MIQWMEWDTHRYPIFRQNHMERCGKLMVKPKDDLQMVAFPHVNVYRRATMINPQAIEHDKGKSHLSWENMGEKEVIFHCEVQCGTSLCCWGDDWMEMPRIEI